MPDQPTKVLLVEDNAGDVRLLRQMLAQADLGELALACAGTLREAQARLAGERYEVVLLDLSLPDSQGLETVRAARVAAPRSAVIVLTGTDDEAVAVEAVRQGAQDYLVKGQVDGRMLWRSVRYALERKRIQDEREDLIGQLQEALATVKKLSGLLPICASCKKIRDEEGVWKRIEAYIRDHSEAQFSHGICPDCMKKLYPGMGDLLVKP